jgi:hypothetical protein
LIIVSAPKEFKAVVCGGNGAAAYFFAVDGKLQGMCFKVTFEGKPGPFLMQLNAVHREADAGKILSYDDFEGAERLVVYEINILIVGRNETHDIAEVDRTAGDETDIEAQLKFLVKAQRIIRSKVQAGPFFLDNLMAVEHQTIRLGKSANR